MPNRSLVVRSYDCYSPRVVLFQKVMNRMAGQITAKALEEKILKIEEIVVCIAAPSSDLVDTMYLKKRRREPRSLQICLMVELGRYYEENILLPLMTIIPLFIAGQSSLPCAQPTKSNSLSR